MNPALYYWLSKHNKELKVVENYFREDNHIKELFRFMPSLTHNLQFLGDEVRVLKPYGDTIFSINKGKPIPAYSLDFNGHKKYNTESVTVKKVEEVYKEKNGVRGVNFIETESRLLLSYTFGTDKLTVFDKNRKSSNTTSPFKSFERPGGFRLGLQYADDDKAIFTYYPGGSRVNELLKEHFETSDIENWTELDFEQMEKD